MKKIIIFISLLYAISYGNIPACAAENRPKNIIICIADGGGYPQMKLTNIWCSGTEKAQQYESFPISLSMATFPLTGSYSAEKVATVPGYLKNNPTDSAAAATAMACGKKTVKGAIGVNAAGATLTNIMETAQKKGRATGVVTSVPFAHATPAGFSAHHPNRNNYAEIARAMIYRSRLSVIMGCGNPLYTDNGTFDDTVTPANAPQKYSYTSGASAWEDISDGTVIPEIDFNGDDTVDKADAWHLIRSRNEFRALITADNPPERVLGIPLVHSTLQEKRSQSKTALPFEVPFNSDVPSLKEMALGALNVLDENANGFVLMIEGGAIDWACHENNAARTVEEMADFNNAVSAVAEWVENASLWDNTLIIVTADHETGYLVIEGPGTEEAPGELQPAKYEKGTLPRLSWHHYYHTNSLVPFYAKGTGAQLFEQETKAEDPVYGKYIDNTAIAKVIFKLLEK